MTYARVGAEWHRWKHVGLLLEYNYTDISASTERNHFTGNLDMRDSGLRLGVVFRRGVPALSPGGADPVTPETVEAAAAAC